MSKTNEIERTSSKLNKRYYELDWLRVILIFAVFLHHILMPFNGDHWHIMNKQSSKLLDDIMVYFEQFRLPVLFFISGASSSLLLSRVSSKVFCKKRLYRLVIPLIVGVIFIVPPQTYIEHIDRYESYWQALPQLMFSFEFNHLWFIKYLVVFTLFAALIHKLLNTSIARKLIVKIEQLSHYKLGLFTLAISLVLLRVGLKFYFDNEDKNITNLSLLLFYFMFFMFGMIFIESHRIWQNILIHRQTNLKLLICCSVVFYIYYFLPDLSDYFPLSVLWGIWWGLGALVAWSATLVLIGYAQCYLNYTQKYLNKINELIYPFYILHQTIIVVFGYFIISLQLSIATKIILLLFSSLTSTALVCWYVIYPFNFMRNLFGLNTILFKP